MTSRLLFLFLFMLPACNFSSPDDPPHPRVTALESTGGGGGSSGAGGAACCPASTAPGCSSNTAVEACVCARDAYCCSVQWDAACVIEVTSYGCSNLCGGSGAGGSAGSGGAPACCPQKGTPGCDDPVVEACVCDTLGDGFCCATRWDQDCAAQANGPCACSAGPSPQPGSCCEATEGTPGCTDPAVALCVCALDPGCCSNEWDEACVEEVGEFACGPACPAP